MALKVLISAYACEPGRGSEPGVGWNVIRRLADRHELWVLTRANNEPAIRAADEDWTCRVHWLFVDPPPWIARYKKGASGLRPYYLLWQRLAKARALELLHEQEIDLIHHLTFGHFLPPSPLALLGKPFVAGPLGGGESAPPELLAGTGGRTRWLEWLREASHRLTAMAPRTRAAYRKAAFCLATTPQTAHKLRVLGARDVSVVPQSGIGHDEWSRLAALAAALPAPQGPLRLVAASRMIHWKGLDLALDAVAQAGRGGLDVRLDLLHDGPDRRRLEAQVRRLGLCERVRFLGRLPTLDDVYRTIAAADALIHPALHEAFGQACLESLALGVPVICLDWAGPGEIIDSSCGYKVTPSTRDATVHGLAEAMRSALAGRTRRSEISAAARRRAADFLWERVVQGIEGAWRQPLEQSKQVARPR